MAKCPEGRTLGERAPNVHGLMGLALGYFGAAVIDDRWAAGTMAALLFVIALLIEVLDWAWQSGRKRGREEAK